MKFDFSRQGWTRVITVTVLGTLACMAIALFFDSFNFRIMDEATRLRAILTDVFVPLVLAGPLLFFFSSKLRELAIAHERLTVYASTDGLTKVMNRAAFSTLAEAYLAEVRAAEDKTKGALLIIDADNFKSVNDRYGHDRGDEALVTIADAIKTMLRAPDLVGRLGGEEFGVFLPGATPDQAAIVAERIRTNVSSAEFKPGGMPHLLSVSVGGAVFQRALPFADLFRYADQQLYAAKQKGRNRVEIAPVSTESYGLAAA